MSRVSVWSLGFEMRGYIGLSRENACPIAMYATDDKGSFSTSSVQGYVRSARA